MSSNQRKKLMSNVSTLNVRQTEKKLLIEVDLNDTKWLKALLNVLVGGVMCQKLTLSDHTQKVVSELVAKTKEVKS